jgi:hypothetical protein
VSLVVIENHHVIKTIVFPCFSKTFGFSGKEWCQKISTFSFALIDFRIESCAELADIASPSKALLTPKD